MSHYMMSGTHGAPGGAVRPTGLRARRGERVLHFACGCACTDTTWLEWCEPARAEYMSIRAQIQNDRNQAVPGLEELLA